LAAAAMIAAFIAFVVEPHVMLPRATRNLPPSFLPKYLASVLLMTLVWLAAVIITVAATTRAALYPDQPSLAAFRLSFDEVRLGISLFGVWLILVVAAAISLAVGLFMLGFLGVAGPGGPRRYPIPVEVSIAVAPLVLMLAYLPMRFVAAPAMVIDGGKVNIFGSFGLTRGSLWRLARAHLLVIFAVVASLSMAVALLPTLSQLETSLDRRVLYYAALAISIVVISVIQTLSVALGAYIYRQLSGPAVEDIF
jgi:hypothetical protein